MGAAGAAALPHLQHWLRKSAAYKMAPYPLETNEKIFPFFAFFIIFSVLCSISNRHNQQEMVNFSVDVSGYFLFSLFIVPL